MNALITLVVLALIATFVTAIKRVPADQVHSLYRRGKPFRLLQPNGIAPAVAIISSMTPDAFLPRHGVVLPSISRMQKWPSAKSHRFSMASRKCSTRHASSITLICRSLLADEICFPRLTDVHGEYKCIPLCPLSRRLREKLK